MNNLIKDVLKLTTAVAAGAGATYHATVNDNPNPVTVMVEIQQPRFKFSEIKGIGTYINKIRLANTKLFPVQIDTIQFNKFIANLPFLIGSDSLTLQEFVCLAMCTYNETGGRYISLSERGDDAYFFEQRKLTWGNKLSYNTLYGNIPAGNFLKSKGIQANYQAWNNSVQYPHNAPNSTKELARNADFFKYRGMGYIQITGRVNFMQYVRPLLPEIDNITHKELEWHFLNTPEVGLGAVKNYLTSNLSRWNHAMQKVNIEKPQWDAFGHLISGKAKYHNFAERCDFIYYRLKQMIKN